MLRPVVLKVPQEISGLKPKDRAAALSRFARESVMISGQRTGLLPERLETGENGEPLCAGGVCWSLSHKRDYVVGLVSEIPAGIDLEKIKPVSRHLFDRVISEPERREFGGEGPDIVFFRTFTAKEAVLKCTGKGLAGLKDVQVTRVLDACNIDLQYRGRKFRVESICFDGHIASVVKNETDRVDWRFD